MTDDAANVTLAEEEVIIADEAAAESNGVLSGPWYYCLEARHPGANEVIHPTRFFQWTGDPGACPECPACGRQVSSVPAKGEGVYPSGLLAVAERLL
jgi:hypothetical protein